MKKVVVVLVISVFTISLWANGGKKGIIRSMYDVVAPVLVGEPAAADRQVGQIFYDNSAGAFKGVNKVGGIDTLTAAGNFPAAIVDSVNDGAFSFVDGGSIIIYNTEHYDPTGMYDPLTGQFTISEAGIYTMSASISFRTFDGSPSLVGNMTTLIMEVNGDFALGSHNPHTFSGTPVDLRVSNDLVL